jgi:hypothetical protein
MASACLFLGPSAGWPKLLDITPDDWDNSHGSILLSSDKDRLSMPVKVEAGTEHVPVNKLTAWN